MGNTIKRFEMEGNKQESSDGVERWSISCSEPGFPLNGTWRRCFEECEWKYVDDDWGIYETQCDHAYCFEAGDLKENNYTYCPACGRRVKEVEHDRED